MNYFNEVFKELRLGENLTQEQLGQELGVPQHTIAKWERGIHTPKLNMLIKIADYFEVTLDYLVGRSF
ncbi:MAG: helix-turn-helix domain-containing protein [Firmicutes bacterium]|nr:helix-turn-helix domain-containing protein [Bacillota bacterium]